MEAPLKLTPIFRKFWVPKPFREKMTQRILNPLDLLLDELNHQKLTGTFSFPDLLYFVLFPIFACWVIIEIVLIAYYFSAGQSIQNCQDIYNNCLNPTTNGSSPGEDACSTLYQKCLLDTARPEGVVALIVLGAIGAAYFVFLLIGYFAARKMDKRELERVMGICYQYKPIIEAILINPKYMITLKFGVDGCCFVNAFESKLVIYRKDVVFKKGFLGDFEDLTITRDNQMERNVECEDFVITGDPSEAKSRELSANVYSGEISPELYQEMSRDNVRFKSFGGE